MPRFRFAALAASTLALTCSAAAQAAPTGTIAGRDDGNGAWSIAAQVTWDLCPQVCDWQINVIEVNQASDCSQDGRWRDGRDPLSGGLFGRKTYTSNGPQVDGITGINSLAPSPQDTTRVLCLAAVGLTPLVERPASFPSYEAQVQWEVAQAKALESCPDAAPIYATALNRCMHFYPLGSVRVDVKGAPQQPYDPLKALQLIRGTGTVSAPVRAPALTRSEAVRALRRKKLRGKITCKKLGPAKQRCRVTTKQRKRTYMVTETAKGIRVKRA